MIGMKKFLPTISSICLVAAALTACAPNPTPNTPTENGGVSRLRNEGYSLLHKLMSDESQVGQIFVLKHADPDVGTIVKSIGAAAQIAKQRLDDFAKADNMIEFDVSDLPAVEQESRDATASVDTHELLFSNGDTFELNLLFTQAQAMTYASQLSKSLASHEDDATRKQFLTDLSKQCDDFRAGLMNLLAVKSAPATAH
jgi:hypothetical protein